MKAIKAITLAVVLVSLLMLGACNSGGDGGNVPPPPGSSNWDEMVWDQDNWG